MRSKLWSLPVSMGGRNGHCTLNDLSLSRSSTKSVMVRSPKILFRNDFVPHFAITMRRLLYSAQTVTKYFLHKFLHFRSQSVCALLAKTKYIRANFSEAGRLHAVLSHPFVYVLQRLTAGKRVRIFLHLDRSAVSAFGQCHMWNHLLRSLPFSVLVLDPRQCYHRKSIFLTSTLNGLCKGVALPLAFSRHHGGTWHQSNPSGFDPVKHLQSLLVDLATMLRADMQLVARLCPSVERFSGHLPSRQAS